MIFSTRVNPLERAPEKISVQSFQRGNWTLAQCIYWYSNFGLVPISCSTLFHKVLPCNSGKIPVVNLLPSLRSMLIKAFGAYDYLGKHLK